MTTSAHSTVLATLGRSIEGFCRELRIDLLPILQSVGLDPNVFHTEGAHVELRAFANLIQRIAEQANDESIGIRLGEFYKMGDSGALGFGILNSPTLGKAIEFNKRYQYLIGDYLFFDIDVGDPMCHITWLNSTHLDASAVYVDFRAVIKVKMLRHFLGSHFFPSLVILARPPPKSLNDHQRVFGRDVQFDAAMNKIVLPSKLLETTSASADNRLLAMMKRSCDQQLEKLQKTKDIRLRFKEAIFSSLPNGDISLAHVAKELGMSERSLQRRLSRIGLTYEELAEEARKGLSDRLLSSAATIAEIAEYCGYSSQGAYTRAATDWYGESPSSRRKRLLQKTNANDVT